MPSQTVSFPANSLAIGENLNSARNLKLGEMSQIISGRFERGSGVYTGPGYFTVKNLATSTQGRGSLGAKVFRAHWVINNGNAHYSTSPDGGTYYNAGLSLTDEATNIQEQGNGDLLISSDNSTNTRIAVAKLTTALAASDTTITIGADHITKFAASGTVRINNTNYTYTGKSGNNLTGVQEGGGAVTTAQAVNSLVLQTSNPSTWTEEKFLWSFELESRFIGGGVKNFEQNVYASAPEDIDNPAFFYDFDANGTVAKVFTQKMIAGIAGIGRGFVFAENECHQISSFDITTGAFLTSPISKQYGVYNRKCVVDMDGIIAFFGNNRLIPIVIQSSPDGTIPVIDEAFDDDIRPWLDELDPFSDQADAYLHYDPSTKLLKIGARRDGTLETRVYDRQTGSFVGSESRPAYTWAHFDGKSYFVDSTGKINRDDFGRTNAGFAILHKWATGRMEYEKGRREMQLYKLEYEGFMSQGSTHTFRVYIDGSSEATYEQIFDDTIITSSNGVALGTRGVGTSLISDIEGAATLAYPYKNHILLRGITCEDVKLEWECTRQGAFFQTNSFNLTSYLIRRNERTYN